jgi:glycoprotein 3-alpha-L-fucosyltransferase
LPPLKFVDKRFHDHVLKVPKAKNDSRGTVAPKDLLDEPKYFDSIMQMHVMTDPAKGKRVWPDKDFDWDDRIQAHMKHIPKTARAEQEKPFDQQKTKLIIIWNGIGNTKKGRQRLVDDKCPVTQCYLTGDRSKVTHADVLLFQHSVANPGHRRPPNQIWATYFLESPYHTPALRQFKDIVNWTATYRHDSTIVAPYEKFVPFNNSVVLRKQPRNYAFGKTKKVAWFVSNCGARNKRKDYAMKLQIHIDVQIYGACGPYKCPRYQAHKCFELLNKDYKFYLSFENSNCRDYITEKFFVTGLQ